MDLTQLKRASLAELEAIYAADQPLEIPRGRYHGIYLATLQSPGARRPLNRAMAYLGFDLTPFGVDFDSCHWYFVHPWLQVGHFEAEIAQSRWRATRTVALYYDVSRLPGPIRRHLYDEIKPLSADLCLGMGGLNRDRDEGELFFFALHR